MELKPIDVTRYPREIIDRDFPGLYSGNLGLSSIKGGQSAANDSLARLDIVLYAEDRSEVLPKDRRGATVLSPYIRHNLLTLGQVYNAVKDAPFKDREKFRDELILQKHSRHLSARIIAQLLEIPYFEANRKSGGDGWNREMPCIDTVVV